MQENDSTTSAINLTPRNSASHFSRKKITERPSGMVGYTTWSLFEMKPLILARNLWSHVAERISALRSLIRPIGASLAEECRCETSLSSNAPVLDSFVLDSLAPISMVSDSVTTDSNTFGSITVGLTHKIGLLNVTYLSSSPYGTKPCMPSPYMPLTE